MKTGFTPSIRARLNRWRPRDQVNYGCHIVEGALAIVSFELTGIAALFPILANRLGASPTLLGILNAAILGISALAGLMAASRLEVVRRKKHLIVLFGWGQRLALVLIGTTLVLVAGEAPTLALFLIAGFYLVQMIFNALAVPPWIDLLAETLPHDKAPRIFGLRITFSSVMTVLLGLAVGVVIRAVAFPLNFAIVYAISLSFSVVSLSIFAMVDEIPKTVPVKAQREAHHYFRELIAAIRADGNYRQFLIYQCLCVLGMAVVPFYTLAAVRHHGVRDAFAAGAFIAANAAAKVLGSLTFPSVAHRFGFGRLLTVGSIFLVAAGVLAALAPKGEWYVAVMFLIGLGLSAQWVGGVPFQMRLYPRGRRVGYFTLSAVVLAPLQMIGPLAAGAIMDQLGHATLFFACAAVMLTTVVPLAFCRLAPTTSSPASSVSDQAHHVV
jgi:MFS family permease